MSFLTDVHEVAVRIRDSMESGAVTPYYALSLSSVHNVLQGALASEIICVLRYQQHYYMTTSVFQDQIQGLMKEHWHDEQEHLGRIAERLKQLGGVPNFNPAGVTERGFSTFEYGHSLAEMLREDLVAERIVIKMYSDIVTFFGSADPVSRRLFEDILKDEEDHADEIADLLYTVDPASAEVAESFAGDSEFVHVAQRVRAVGSMTERRFT
jgi:bacterioferritin